MLSHHHGGTHKAVPASRPSGHGSSSLTPTEAVRTEAVSAPVTAVVDAPKLAAIGVSSTG